MWTSLPRRRHYEGLWREGVAELVALLDAEHPEDRGAAPKVGCPPPCRRRRLSESAAAPASIVTTLSPTFPRPPQSLEDWARLYIRYVQTLRKLCAAHDGVAQPQKRACLRGTLEACMGRVLELRAWLAALNNGVDVLGEALGDQLVALSLTPDALELPVPAYFREARAEALAARAEAAAAAVAAGDAAGAGVSPGEQAADGPADGTQEAEEADSSSNEEAEQSRQQRVPHSGSSRHSKTRSSQGVASRRARTQPLMSASALKMRRGERLLPQPSRQRAAAGWRDAMWRPSGERRWSFWACCRQEAGAALS